MTVIGHRLTWPIRLTRGPASGRPAHHVPCGRDRRSAASPSCSRIYREWYERIIEVAAARAKAACWNWARAPGFFAELCPRRSPRRCSAARAYGWCGRRRAAVRGRSLRAIVMTDVMHHIPDPQAFLAEARRIVKPGGRIAMIEPWVSAWSRFVYTRLHHEPFRPEASSWSFPSSGPLSGANGAVPWIVFERDRARFQRVFPTGASRRSSRACRFATSFPAACRCARSRRAGAFPCSPSLERLTQPWMRSLAMFAFIQLERR